MSDVTIYALCEPDTGEVRYIGQTQQELSTRLYNHLADARNPVSSPPRIIWLRSLLVAGLTPTIRPLSTTSPTEALIVERRQIQEHEGRGCVLVNVTHNPQQRHFVTRRGPKPIDRRVATWRAALRLPDMAGHQLEEIAKQWGVQPAVAARIAVMEWLHRRENGEHEAGKPDVGVEEGGHE